MSQFAKYADPQSDPLDEFNFAMPAAGQRSPQLGDEPRKDVDMLDDSGYLDAAPRVSKGQEGTQQEMDTEEDELAPSPAPVIVAQPSASANATLPNVAAISAIPAPSTSQQEPEPTLGRLSNRPPLNLKSLALGNASAANKATGFPKIAAITASASMPPPSRPPGVLERSATPPNVFAMPTPSASLHRLDLHDSKASQPSTRNAFAKSAPTLPKLSGGINKSAVAGSSSMSLPMPKIQASTSKVTNLPTRSSTPADLQDTAQPMHSTPQQSIVSPNPSFSSRPASRTMAQPTLPAQTRKPTAPKLSLMTGRQSSTTSSKHTSPPRSPQPPRSRPPSISNDLYRHRTPSVAPEALGRASHSQAPSDPDTDDWRGIIETQMRQIASHTSLKEKLNAVLDENARLRDDLAQKEAKIGQLDEDKKQIGTKAAEKVKQALYSMETINLENAHLKEELTVAIERYRDLYETQFADISSQREEIDLAMKELAYYVDGEGRMSIEQNEASRFELLREQAEMMENHQQVTAMLREQLETKIGELTEQRARCDRLQSKIVGPANHATALAKNIVELQNQAQIDQATWSRQHAVLQCQLVKVQQEKESLANQLVAERFGHKETVERLEANFSDAQSTLDDLRSRNVELESDIASHLAVSAETAKNLESSQSSLLNLQEVWAEASSLHTESSRRVKELEIDLHESRKATGLADQRNAVLDAECTSSQSAVSKAERKIEQLEARVVELTPLIARASRADELAQELDAARQTVEQIRNQLRAEETAKATSTAKVEVLSQNNAALQQRCEKVVALETENTNFQKTLSDKSEQLNSTLKQVDKLEGVSRQLVATTQQKDDLASRVEELVAQQRESSHADADLGALQERNATLQLQVDSIPALQAELATAKASKIDIQERLSNAEDRIKQLQIFQGRAEALDAQCHTLQESVEQERSAVTDARNDLAQTNTELAVAQELARSRLETQTDYSARLRTSEEAKEQLTTQLLDLQAQLSTIQHNLQRKEQQVTAATEKADSLLHYEELASRTQIECAVAETKLEAEVKLKAALQAKVEILEKENEKSGQQCAIAKSSYTQLEDQLAKLKLAQTSLQQEKVTLQEKLSTIQAESQTRHEAASHGRDQIQNLTLQLADLATHLDQRTTQVDALESQKRELEDQVIQLGSELASAQTAAAEAQSGTPAISAEEQEKRERNIRQAVMREAKQLHDKEIALKDNELKRRSKKLEDALAKLETVSNGSRAAKGGTRRVIAQPEDPTQNESQDVAPPPKPRPAPAQSTSRSEKPAAQPKETAESELSDIADFSDEEQSREAALQAGPRKRRKPNEADESQEVRMRKPRAASSTAQKSKKR